MNKVAQRLKENWIRLFGPQQPIRFGKCRFIDIVQYLPEYLQDSQVQQLFEVFNEYLNEMYEGECGLLLEENPIDVTACDIETSSCALSPVIGTYRIDSSTHDTFTEEVASIEFTNQCVPQSGRISILEKIHRLSDLIDPDLIPIELIQHYANNLGYSVGLSREDIGQYFLTSADIQSYETSAEQLLKQQFESNANRDKYLRFIIRNLPEWYKIKTTRNAVQMMLFSFGLIGDFVYYYTTDYKDPTIDDSMLDVIRGIENDDILSSDITFKELYKQICIISFGLLLENGTIPDQNVNLTGINFENWILTLPRNLGSKTTTEDISNIRNVDAGDNPYVSTPHFKLWYSIDDSVGLLSEKDRQTNIKNAVLSIKPINTVFDGIAGYTRKETKKYVFPFINVKRHIVLRNE